MIHINIIDIYIYMFLGVYYAILIYFVLRYLVFPINKFELEDNQTINKGKYIMTDKKVDDKKYKEEILDYKISKQIDKVPSRKNRVTCVILRENNSSKILYIPFNLESFIFEKCIYFTTNSHTCDNNAKLCVYLEGISIPFSCKNIQREQVTRPYRDFFTGEMKTKVVNVIKGLKFDGKILNTFSDRKFAEIFTRPKSSFVEMLLLIVGSATLIVSIVCIGVSYYYR